MKTLVISDIHGREVDSFLRKVVDSYKPTRFMCLGDFDRAGSVKSYLKLRNYLKLKGVEVVEVPGNHDHALLNGFRYIHSSFFEDYQMNALDLYNELVSDRRTREFLEELVNKGNYVKRFSLEGKEGNFDSVLVHGGLGGEFPTTSYPLVNEARELWVRTRNREGFMLNFGKMKKRNLEITLKGHEHQGYLVEMDKNGEMASFEGCPGCSYELEKGKMYTILAPPFFAGEYLTIDDGTDKKPIVKFHKAEFPPSLSRKTPFPTIE